MLLYSNFLYSLYLHSGEFYIVILILLALFSLYNYKSFKMHYKLMLLLILGFVFFELTSKLTSMIGYTNNHFINHPYSIFTLVVSSIFLNKFISKKWVMYLSIFLNIVFIGLDIIQVFSPEGLLQSPQYFFILSFLISGLSIFLQTQLIKSKKIKSLNNEPIFWFNIGFIIMNVSLIILMPLFNYAIAISNDLAFIIGTVKNLSDPFAYVFWAIGVSKLSKNELKPISFQ